jgi:hypothetical protein
MNTLVAAQLALSKFRRDDEEFPVEGSFGRIPRRSSRLGETPTATWQEKIFPYCIRKMRYLFDRGSPISVRICSICRLAVFRPHTCWTAIGRIFRETSSIFSAWAYFTIRVKNS